MNRVLPNKSIFIIIGILVVAGVAILCVGLSSHGKDSGEPQNAKGDALVSGTEDSTVDYDSENEASVSYSETETSFKPYDNYTDISKVSVGMTYDEALKVLDKGSYAFALGAGLYVNDFKTGHVFNVKFALESWPWVVESITDTGIDVDFIASVEALDRLEKGMSFDEVVQILGRPLYIPTSGVITMLWRIENHESCVCLPFVDGERMIYDGDDKPTVFSMK
ncbi:MAG: hypothetical protein J6T65_07540 [Clostridia bacterium]|nr:hypothetical protein [Clostridia bacterium]